MTTLAFSPRTMTLHSSPWEFLRLGLRGLPQLARIGYGVLRLKLCYGLRGLGLVTLLTNPGLLTLVFTTREFQPAAEQFGDAYRFVGPMLADAPVEIDESFGNGPLVLVAHGTLETKQTEFYGAIVDAFRDLPIPVVMATGRSGFTPPADLPSHIVLRERVPQMSLLSRAALFCTHAGMNSVMEALWHGVPMLLFPQTNEQRTTARRVEEVGAGKILPAGPPKASVVRALAERLMNDPTYREAAAVQQSALRASGNVVRAVDDILALIRQPRIERARSAVGLASSSSSAT